MNTHSLLTLLALASSALCSPIRVAAAPIVPHGVPDEFASLAYTVTVNGTPVKVFHAGLNVHFASFDFTGTAEIKVTVTPPRTTPSPAAHYSGQYRHRYVPSPPVDFWQSQAIVRPLSRQVAATTQGPEARFTLTAPGQYSVERPGTSHYLDQVLLLFANRPAPAPSPERGRPDVIHLESGIHQRNLDLLSGQTLYLAPGAVLFGAINVWNARDVKILGRGVVVYDGPQSELRDTGLHHRRNWHPLTTCNVYGLTVEGITFVGRSRTWSLQLHSTVNSSFDNVKVLAVPAANVNGDGFDWYGGGKTRISNSFVRAADDLFAFFVPPELQDSTGTGRPAAEVKDILIENCVLWSTLANVYRIGFGAQRLRTENIRMRQCDVIRIAQGEWHAPWSIVHTMTTGVHGKSEHCGYLFEDVRFEEATAFIGVQNEQATFRDVVFRRVSMQGTPVPSLVRGPFQGLTFDGVTLNGRPIRSPADLPLREDSRPVEAPISK